ncbi:hypothetical protein [Vibrio diabolicus]|uniref:hypothetical protein n=1 Tax=Vibrio diabolicus TaxID=50719 RepID=UPI00215FF540|nr:hypothetical protein [Vibrio diabolicus]MCS0324605.1 hypothetical protein [Vibrio diabolicus]
MAVFLMISVLLLVIGGVIVHRKGRSALGFIGLSILFAIASGFINPVFVIIAPFIALCIAMFMKQGESKVEESKLAKGILKKCEHCAELVKADAKICKHCKLEITS